MSFPVAKIPATLTEKHIEPCITCGKQISLTKWDRWNRFLVICPHCRRVHGREWNRKAILWASLFVNAFSFFFTMRPKKALVFFLSAIAINILAYFAISYEWVAFPLDVLLAIFLIFAPVMINGVLIVAHKTFMLESRASRRSDAMSFLEETLSFAQEI